MRKAVAPCVRRLADARGQNMERPTLGNFNRNQAWAVASSDTLLAGSSVTATFSFWLACIVEAYSSTDFCTAGNSVARL